MERSSFKPEALANYVRLSASASGSSERRLVNSGLLIARKAYRMTRARYIFSTIVAIALVASASPCVVTYAGDDFLDSLNQIEPDASERPNEPQINIPDSLETYLQSSHSKEHTSVSEEESLSQMVRWLVLKNLPPTYEDNRGWGKQKEVYDGFRFRREGMKVETYRKYKTVKHGTWKRYHLEFVDPESTLQLRITNLRDTAQNRIAFHLTLNTPLKVFGRVSKWQRDVQLISISTNADVAVELDVDVEVGVLINPLVFPPDMQFSPKVTRAMIRLTNMEVDRISQIRGDIAEELGKSLRRFVDEYLEDYDEKLVDKMNKQLEKQKDKLRLSTADYLPRFSKSIPLP